MFSNNPMVATFASNDIAATKDFYHDVLGAEVVVMDPGMCYLKFESGAMAFAYEKDDFQAPNNTILTFLVPDIDAAAAELKAKGVNLEHLEYTDDDGIARGWDNAPPSAWIKDTSGNWICFTQGTLEDMPSA